MGGSSSSGMLHNPMPSRHSQLRYPTQCVFLKLNASWPAAVQQERQQQPSSPGRRLRVALYSVWAWYVVVSVSVTCGFQAAFLVRTFGDIMKTTENMCTTLMGLLNLMRLIHMRLNQRKFRQLIGQFAEHIWIEKGTQPAVERRCELQMRIFRVMSLLTAGLIIMYVTMPLAEYYGTPAPERLEKPFPYKMIFFYDAQRSWRYVLTYVFTSLAGICVVTTLFAEDSFFGFYVVYACGQFELLHQRIRNLLPDAHARVSQRYGVDGATVSSPQFAQHFQSECRQRLKAIAIKHRQIIAFAHALEDFFSGVLLVNFLISSVLICMVGFQLMTSKGMFIGDLLKMVVYISSSFSQLGILCWQGDSLITHSTATANCLYACHWEGGAGSLPKGDDDDDHKDDGLLPKARQQQRRTVHAAREKFRRNLLHKRLKDIDAIGGTQCDFLPPVTHAFRMDLRLMVLCSQKPLRITAFKFSTLSLQSFTAIISTSMSYFTLLQSVYSKMEN